MPLYYFVLKGNARTHPDEEGVELPDLAAARAHAIAVAQELMRNRECRTGSWRIQICDDYLRVCSEILFAEVDKTLEHVMPKMKETHEMAARKTASLHDALESVYHSLQSVRETLATADRLIAQVTPRSGPQQQ